MVESLKVYTAIAGKYLINRTDIKCFGSNAIFQQPVMEAKRYKVLPHLFLADDVTIWLDGNVWLKVDPQEAVDMFLGDADLALFAHPYRKTVWQEFAALREQRRFQIPWLQQQLGAQEDAYRAAGLPDDAPLYECSMLIRRNNDRMNALMERWWAQICRWQWRDQVSLPYVLHEFLKRGVEVSVAAHALNIREHPMFRYESQY